MVDDGQRQCFCLGPQDSVVDPDAEQYGIGGLLAPININAGVALRARHAELCDEGIELLVPLPGRLDETVEGLLKAAH